MSMNSDFTIAAQFLVEQFIDSGDALMAAHREAMDCRDCEDFLQKGIESFETVSRMERAFREASYEGKFDFTAELRDTFDSFYLALLGSCGKADEWIERNAARGLAPDNLERFREVRAEMEHQVEVREIQRIGREAALSREETSA